MRAVLGRRVTSVTLPVDGCAEVVAHVRLYLALLCRRRAFIEFGARGVVVHFEASNEAATFADIWDDWAVTGLIRARARTSRHGTSHIKSSREENGTMRLRSKVILKKKLSGETLDSVRIYLREFADGRHTIEHFDGMMSTCLRDRADVELVRRSFPSLIADVRTLY